jgi:hypothetical protein
MSVIKWVKDKIKYLKDEDRKQLRFFERSSIMEKMYMIQHNMEGKRTCGACGDFNQHKVRLEQIGPKVCASCYEKYNVVNKLNTHWGVDLAEMGAKDRTGLVQIGKDGIITGWKFDEIKGESKC